MRIKALSGIADIIGEHRGQAKKIWMLGVNDLIKKYKGAVMGPLWAIIKPSFTLFISNHQNLTYQVKNLKII